VNIAGLKSHWENVTDSLWFVPGLCILILIGMAFVVPGIDERIDASAAFPGDASAARTILQVVAGSLITVISLVFSITILVLQQASQQYTPRLIGNFMSFRGVQIVLGVFLGTFVYALLILRHVSQGDDGVAEYIPELSVSGAIVLATACIGLLVYFIHHTAVSLEVPAVTRRVANQLHDSIGQHYPSSGEPVEGDDSLDAFRAGHPGSVPVEIRAVDSGFVRRVDEQRVLDAIEHAEWIAVRVSVGSYVHHGDLLLEVGGLDGLDDRRVERLRQAVALDIERSIHQDPLFGIRQLVDIALRALSPSLNDPTTAEYALFELGDILIALGRQPYASRSRIVDINDGKQIYLWVARPRFDDYVHEAFAQIRRMAADKPHVMLHLLGVIGSVARNLGAPDRLDALRRELEEALEAIEKNGLSDSDQQAVRAKANEVLRDMFDPAGQHSLETGEAHRDR
jgi:uncharacterized membrane protein